MWNSIVRKLTTGARGRVIVTGGAVGTSYQPLNSTELYNPQFEMWTSAAPMLYPRFTHLAFEVKGGFILVAGGYTQPNQQAATATAELYDPIGGHWKQTNPLTEARARLLTTAVSLGDGRVLVTGGQYEGTLLASTEVYDLASEMWTLSGKMSRPRSGFTTTLLADGRVLSAGGQNASGVLATAELYYR